MVGVGTYILFPNNRHFGSVSTSPSSQRDGQVLPTDDNVVGSARSQRRRALGRILWHRHKRAKGCVAPRPAGLFALA